MGKSEHYIDSDDAAIQQTWEAAEQAVLANQDGPDGRARHQDVLVDDLLHHQPGSIIHIGYWRVNEPAAESGSTDDAALAIEWFAEDDTSLDTYEYTIDHVIEHGLEGSPTFVFHHRSGRRRQPVPLATCHQSAAFAQGVRRGRAAQPPAFPVRQRSAHARRHG